MPEEEAKAVNNPDTGNQEANPKGDTTQPSQAEVGSKEYNWRQMERRTQELELRNRELLETLQKIAVPQQAKEEELPELSPTDIPEWKNVTQYAEKIAEKKFNQLLAEREKQQLPQRARQKFSDFDQVVTPERVKELETNNPELAEAISKSSDPYSATYSALKLYMKPPSKSDERMKEEAEKIMENSKKPISSNAVGKQSALSNAHAFAKKPKDLLYKEMMNFANRG